MINSARNYYITKLHNETIVNLEHDRRTITHSINVTTRDVNVKRSVIQADILDGITQWFDQIFHKPVSFKGLPVFVVLNDEVLNVVFTSHITENEADVVIAENIGLLITSSDDTAPDCYYQRVELKSSTEDAPAFIQLGDIVGYDYQHQLRAGAMRSIMDVECK